MTGCKHCIVRDLFEKREFRDENGEVYAIMNEHVGYEHVCDGGHQKEYDKWHERNKENTYEVYKRDFIDCFEPTELAESLDKMINLANEILETQKVSK